MPALVAALANCRKIADTSTRDTRQKAIILVHSVLTNLVARLRVQGSEVPERDREDLVNGVLVGILDRDGLRLETTSEAAAHIYLAAMLRTRWLDRLRKDKPHRHLSIGDPLTEAGTVDVDVETLRLGIERAEDNVTVTDLEPLVALLRVLARLAHSSCGADAFRELLDVGLASDPAARRAQLVDAELVKVGDAKKARDNVNQRATRARKRLKVAVENDPVLSDAERRDLLVLLDALRERRSSHSPADPVAVSSGKEHSS